ncbi:MAG: ABC transporter ATP-binding protein [Polyangiaceae bacterium]|jgi:putative ABC transport system ATP-binding protein|nr:ABC transporter ATP-binding protein [Polyangiaceae bacterium]
MNRVIARLVAVTKRYGRGPAAHLALRGIHLQARAGEVLMISGPSGSGKTTCLSLLGCLLRPTTGHVELCGHDMTGASEHALAEFRLRTVGFLFQAHHLVASLTALDNVAALGRLRSIPRARADAMARALLNEVGLAAKAERLPADLSGGELQRVGVARGLIGEPPLLLADEPTASLDAKNGLAISELLRDQAKRRGRAVVIVTHDARIFHLADRRVVIEDGTITGGVT